MHPVIIPRTLCAIPTNMAANNQSSLLMTPREFKGERWSDEANVDSRLQLRIHHKNDKPETQHNTKPVTDNSPACSRGKTVAGGIAAGVKTEEQYRTQ